MSGCEVLMMRNFNSPLVFAFAALHNSMETFSAPKMFILVSTVMTWACSKAVDPVSGHIPDLRGTSIIINMLFHFSMHWCNIRHSCICLHLCAHFTVPATLSTCIIIILTRKIIWKTNSFFFWRVCSVWIKQWLFSYTYMILISDHLSSNDI